jgi:hypothetical protein
VAGRLTVYQRVRVIHAAMPDLVDRLAHELQAEMLDVEIVLAGGRPPGMTEETRRRVLEEARKFLEEPKA